MSLGEFVLINAYVVRLVQPLEMLGVAVRDIAQGLAFLTNMLSLLRENAESTASSEQAGASRAAACGLTFDNVSFSYDGGTPLLKNISFYVPAGKTVAIVGASGSGKSSIIRLLFRLYEPDDGKILIDGVSTGEMSLSAVRQAVGIVPQDAALFHDSVAGNISLGRYGASHADIELAAKVADIHEMVSALPEGYRTAVGERGKRFSGGERQRIAIARAALKRARILVCDEATASLDTRSELQIMSNLRELAKGCTTLVIAHRLSTVVHADEILVLSQGVIVERGTHEQLRALDGHYSRLWNAQQEVPDGTAAIRNARGDR
jgi:ATP-binding cassette subfamily B protein